jgi:rhamnosyltransferase
MAGRRSAPVAAAIVAYRPDLGQLAQLISSLATQVDALFLYCNSPVPAFHRDLADKHAFRLNVLGDGRNIGLGMAYNRIMDAALARGMNAILLFDQDSMPPPNLGAELLCRMQNLIDAGQHPAVIGPRPVAYDGAAYKIPRRTDCYGAEPRGSTMPVQFVISSGSLVNGAAFRDIGPFRDDFFIDAIDIEWCLRAGFKGYTCWMAADVPMRHELGAGVFRVPLCGVHIVRQPPGRAYTFVRNGLALLRLKHIPAAWKVRTAARLILYTVVQTVCSPERRATLRSLRRGWWDGLLGRLGPPRDDARHARIAG